MGVSIVPSTSTNAAMLHVAMVALVLTESLTSLANALRVGKVARAKLILTSVCQHRANTVHAPMLSTITLVPVSLDTTTAQATKIAQSMSTTVAPTRAKTVACAPILWATFDALAPRVLVAMLVAPMQTNASRSLA